MWRFKHAPTSAVLNLSRRNDHGGSPERKIKEENRGMCRNEKGMEPGGEARSNEKRVIVAKDCPSMLLVTLNVPIPIRFLRLVVFSF